MKASGQVNAIIVAFHGGYEYYANHISAQTEAGDAFIAAGADLVIMHHPHVVQGLTIRNQRYIFYSLGNFCFGGNNMVGTKNGVSALQSMAVRAVLTFSDAGEYLGQQVTIYPFHSSGTYPKSDFRPVRVYGSEAAEVIRLIQNDTPFQLAPYDEMLGCITQPYLPAEEGVVTGTAIQPSDTH